MWIILLVSRTVLLISHIVALSISYALFFSADIDVEGTAAYIETGVALLFLCLPSSSPFGAAGSSYHLFSLL